ncbi:MAG: ribonuclease P protein component [candidate division Zixibacteria bacterium]|nr:ribonuclease P protein component [candidate division Zixibacteria bacterium]
MRQFKENGFAKDIRIKSRELTNRIYRDGIRTKSETLTLLALNDPCINRALWGVNLSRGFKKAVERNRVKRVIREYMRTHKQEFPENCAVITLASPETGMKDNAGIRNELQMLLTTYKQKCS